MAQVGRQTVFALGPRSAAEVPGAPAEQGSGGASPDLIAAVCRGDEAAWTELVRLYSRRVFALVRSRVRDPELAEEITQSVFVTLAERLPGKGYKEQGRFEPWLFRIAMNRVRDEARRRTRGEKMRSGLRLVGGDAEGDRAADEPVADTGRLKEALASLNDADREIIELRHHASMGFKDIADLLGEPVGTLLARHHRALRKLRAALEDDTSAEENGRGARGD